MSAGRRQRDTNTRAGGRLSPSCADPVGAVARGAGQGVLRNIPSRGVGGVEDRKLGAGKEGWGRQAGAGGLSRVRETWK